MSRGITLAPCGLAIERIETEADKLVIVARAVSGTAACPACGRMSASVHSRYQRVLSDLWQVVIHGAGLPSHREPESDKPPKISSPA